MFLLSAGALPGSVFWPHATRNPGCLLPIFAVNLSTGGCDRGKIPPSDEKKEPIRRSAPSAPYVASDSTNADFLFAGRCGVGSGRGFFSAGGSGFAADTTPEEVIPRAAASNNDNIFFNYLTYKALIEGCGCMKPIPLARPLVFISIPFPFSITVFRIS